MSYTGFMSLDAVVRFRIPKPYLDRLNDVSKRSGLSVSDTLRQAPLDYVRRAEAAGKFEIPIEESPSGLLVAAEGQVPYGRKPPAESSASSLKTAIVVMGDGVSGKTPMVVGKPIRYPSSRMPK